MNLETKFCAPEAKGAALSISEGHEVSGYASLFGQADQGGDVVEAGAYRASLAKIAARGGSVKMLWQHDPAQPIGVWDEVREDGRGLWVKGRILTDVTRGREAAALLGVGAIDGLSIGYRTVRAHKDATGKRRLMELELWEISLVTFPMLPEARVSAKGGSFPAVAALRALAADARAILGPEAKISYAADWSEYHGYQPVGTGDKLFHLDPLWADPNIDFIGIDHYMPLADWREGEGHADAEWGSVYDLGYLQSNIEGGEGFEWYYAGPAARAAQLRTPISDHWGEDWVWRYKDLRGWWSNPHHERVGGERALTPTAWVPQSKPIWLTELGCAAVDKGANEPNRFVDAKSSESGLPHASTGARDELMQQSYLRALLGYYLDPSNNPVSALTGQPMIDVARSHVWAWDARPFPEFPANTQVWSDGDNYARGHWISGRVSGRSLSGVVSEICREAGIVDAETSRIHGLVRGYTAGGGETARALATFDAGLRVRRV